MAPASVDLLVRALLLLAAAWIVVTTLRRRSASLRACVWTVALGAMLLLPALTAMTPALEVPILSPQANPLETSVTTAEIGRPVRTGQDSTSARVTRGSVALAVPGSVVEGPAARAAEPVSAGSRSSASGKSETPGTVSVTMLVVVTWELVAAVLMLRIGVSHVRLARLARVGRPTEQDAQWQALVDGTRAQLRILRPVGVRTADAVTVPAVAGLWRPVLLLPSDASDWTPELQRAVLLHELAHVARWDAFGQLVGQLACAAYWFLPLVWHAARNAAALREHASDDVVLQSGVRPSSYAQNLLSVAERAGYAPMEPAALAMASPVRIRERIVAILDPALRREGVHPRALAAVFATAATVVVLVAAVQPTVKAVEPRASVFVSDSGPLAPLGPITQGIQAPARPAAAAQPRPASSRPCDRDLDKTSASSHDDGDRKYWAVKVSGKDCSVDLRVEGTVEFNGDFTDISSLSRGGSFRLDVTEAGVRRELELRPQGASLERTWRVDGRERPYDNEARAWLAEILVTIDRRTGVGVDHRLPVLLKQGGVDAVLNETALMVSDYARSRYYLKLFDARRLTAPELTRLMRQAESLTKSDHYAGELITAVAKQGFDDAGARAAAFGVIERMESDHYRASAIKTVVGAGRPTAADMEFLLRIVPAVKSDHYKLEVLTTVLQGPLDASQRTVLARAARGIESDHYATEFLKALTRGDLEPAGRQALLDVIATIESDHYVVEALTAVMNRPASRAEAQMVIDALPGIESDHYRGQAIAVLVRARDLNEADLLKVVASVKAMDGDHYQSEALRRIAGHAAATEKVRAAILDVADRMSSHYREEVRRVVGRN